MKTLADLKRRLTPGAAAQVTFPSTVIRGNLGDTEVPGRTLTRKVHSVRAGGVYWENESGGRGSYLDWPKASCLQFIDADTVAVSHEPNGKPFATYKFNPNA